MYCSCILFLQLFCMSLIYKMLGKMNLPSPGWEKKTHPLESHGSCLLGLCKPINATSNSLGSCQIGTTHLTVREFKLSKLDPPGLLMGSRAVSTCSPAVSSNLIGGTQVLREGSLVSRRLPLGSPGAQVSTCRTSLRTSTPRN